MFRFDRLRQCARDKKRSLSYLCGIAEKSNMYIRDLETNNREPPAEVIDAWAKALNVNPAYLTGSVNSPAPPVETVWHGISREVGVKGPSAAEIDRMVQEFCALPPEHRKEIYHQAVFLKEKGWMK